jgi:phosphate transport system permease protein
MSRNTQFPLENTQKVRETKFQPNLSRRHKIGKTWLVVFQFATIVGILALSALIYNITNDSAGYAAMKSKVNPYTLTDGRPLDELTHAELNQILIDNTSRNRYRTINNQRPIDERTREELVDLVLIEVVKPSVINTWTITDSFFKKSVIEKEFAQIQEKNPDAYMEYRVWINWEFITSPQNSDPMLAGILTAIMGSLWIILITMFVAVPIGVGAAIYLEEYANPEIWYNRWIQTNINNLAAVPSIIYGILGLTIFVRALASITSGAAFGLGDPSLLNGRTILSGGFTLGLLVLPLVIINAQEAIRAVPNSLRLAGYGLGATKWQTIRAHVLPNSISGILTGTILAVSRAFGETAPLIVVGVATYITTNPTNIFSKFTTLPAQIYQWTSRPQDVWRSLSASAILVLLITLLALNATAILLRNKYSKKY